MAYIWKSEQTSPGCSGARYAATNAPEPPTAIEPVPAADGLVYDTSVYSDWTLIGTAKGEAYQTALGDDIIDLRTGGAASGPTRVEDVVAAGWYSLA